MILWRGITGYNLTVLTVSYDYIQYYYMAVFIFWETDLQGFR